MSYRIQTFNKIADSGLRQLDGEFEVGSKVESPQGILVRSAPIDTDAFPELLAVARAGAGVNNISVEKATDRGICVFNTPGANANAVAELVFIMLGMVARKIHKSLEFVQELANQSDKEIAESVEKGKSSFRGFELAGKTLGVVGLGKIGVLVANGGTGYGMRVIAYDPAPTIANIHSLSSKVEFVGNLDELLRNTDVLSVHVPLNDRTRNLIDARAIAKVRPGCVFLNFARDGIFDDEAVISALDNGKLDAYLTDFPTRSLISHPKVLATPHLGASTNESEENCAVMAAKQLRDYLEHGVVANSVNFPVVDAAPHQNTVNRLVVINRDVPNMIAQITQVLGNKGINIQSLINESNGRIGYNIIDLQAPISIELTRSIAELPNVLRVRLLNLS